MLIYPSQISFSPTAQRIISDAEAANTRTETFQTQFPATVIVNQSASGRTVDVQA